MSWKIFKLSRFIKIYFTDSLSDDEVDVMIREVDIDEQINYEEFVKMMMSK